MAEATSSSRNFGYRSSALEVVEGIDLSGKVAVVTGGASGIGVETVRALAKAGAHVVLAARDAKKAAGVIAEVIESTGNSKVEHMQLDLCCFRLVREFTDAFLARGLPLHILICNAAIMATPYEKTEDEFESQFGTNHLAHFLLVMNLLPALKASKSARVVCVGSVAAKRAGINWNDINWETDYDKWGAYAQSKSANIMFAKGFNRRFASEGITANALHPGGIMTGLQKFLPTEEMRAMGWLDEQGNPVTLFKNTEQGASTSVWAATAPALEGKGGLYLEDCQIHPGVVDRPMTGHGPWCNDEEQIEKLWQYSLKATGVSESN